MPVRQSIALLAGHDYPERTAAQKFQLMVLGGSQGAKVFAEVIPQAVAELPESQQKKLRIFSNAAIATSRACKKLMRQPKRR